MQELGRMIKKLCSKLFSRIVITGVLILIQAAWFWSLFKLCALAEPADDSLERYHVRGAYPAGFHRAGVQDQLDGSFHDHAGAGRFALPAVGR
jgi:hypothetical protein